MKRVFNYTGVRDWTLFDQDFMQESYQEQAAALVKALVGDQSAVILHGMVLSNDGSNIGDGAIYYNGEIYLFTGGAVPTANPYVNRLDSPSIYDPRIYRDSSSHDTWVDRTVVLSATAGVNNFGRLNDFARYEPFFTTKWKSVDGLKMRREGNNIRIVGDKTMGASATIASWNETLFNARVDRMFSTGDYVVSSGAVNMGDFPASQAKGPVGVILTLAGGGGFSLSLFAGEHLPGDRIEIDAVFAVTTN